MAGEIDSSTYEQANIDPYPPRAQNIFVTVLICVAMLIIILVLFHFFSQYQLRRLNQRLTTQTSSTAPGILAVIANNTTGGGGNSSVDRGLDPSVVSALPSYIHTRNGGASSTETEELECVVCLCDLEEGELVRVLPNCNHKFHLACVDIWLRSHSICPVCRLPVIVRKPAE